MMAALRVPGRNAHHVSSPMPQRERGHLNRRLAAEGIAGTVGGDMGVCQPSQGNGQSVSLASHRFS
jgi:hypothetical protein